MRLINSCLGNCVSIYPEVSVETVNFCCPQQWINKANQAFFA